MVLRKKANLDLEKKSSKRGLRRLQKSKRKQQVCEPNLLLPGPANMQCPLGARKQPSAYFRKTLAVWSSDPSTQPGDIMAYLKEWDYLEDKWYPRNKEQWMGTLVTFLSPSLAIKNQELLNSIHVGGNFPLRAIVLSDWLEAIMDIESRIDESQKQSQTLLAIDHFNPNSSATEVATICEAYGEVEELFFNKGMDDGDQNTVWIAKFSNSSGAYAAQLCLDCKKISGCIVRAYIVKSHKTSTIDRNLAQRDMLLWRK